MILINKQDFIIGFLFLFFSFASYSQNDWRRGYVIKHSGDTIYGLLDYRPPKSNAQYCYFKGSEQAESIKYSPQQIKGYRYQDGKYYVSKSVKINELEQVFFLEFLINGMANVYYLKDEDDVYYVEKNGQLYELKNSFNQIYKNDVRYIENKKEYVGMLNFLFQEADIQNVIYKTKFEHKSLINVAKKYHYKVCTDEECIVYEKKIKPVKIDYGFVFGIYNKTLELDKYLNSKLGIKPSHYFGIALNIRNLRGIYERFSLQLELLASRYYYSNKQKYHFNVPFLLDYRITATRFYPKIELGGSMYYTKNEQINTWRMTLMAGLSFHYEFYKDHRVFFHTRLENNPRMLRFGCGVIF